MAEMSDSEYDDEEEEAQDEVVQVGWAFDEAMMQREDEERAKRKEVVDVHWSRIEASSHGINMKLMAQDPDGQTSTANRSRSPSPRGGRSGGGGPPLDIMDSKVYAQLNALSMVDKIARTREKVETFNARRSSAAEEDQQARQRLHAHIQDGFARSVARQQEVREEQKKRVFLISQKRGEQQKAVNEFKRDAERQLEAYYTKNKHTEASQAPASRTGTPGGSIEGKAKAKGVASEEIYKSTMQSHQEYMGTMQRWHQFVTENERRAEAYWNKMTDGGLAKRGGSKMRRRSTQTASLTKNVFDLAFLSPGAGKEAADDEPIRRQGGRRLDPALSGATAKGAKVCDSNDPATYHLRRAKAVALANTKAKEAKEFGVQHHENLQQARERIARDNRMRTMKAKDYNKAWEMRNDAASLRRSQVELANDDALVRKTAEAQQRRAEEYARRQQEMAENVAEKDRLMHEAITKKKKLNQDFKDSSQARIEEYDEWIADMHKRNNDAHRRMVENSNWEEAAKACQDRRDKAKKDYMKSVRGEMNRKENHTLEVQQARNASVLKQQKVLKREKSTQLSASQPTLGAPTWSRDFSMEFGSGNLSLPALHDPGSPATVKNDPWDEPDLDTLLSMKSPASRAALGGDMEQEFHNEIQNRSSKWLKELRQNATTVV